MTDRLARRIVRACAALALGSFLLPLAPHAGAQDVVGNAPEESPFRDLEYRQEITGFTGWYAAGKDPAGVAPRSGPLLGVRYDVRVGGPASFTARMARVGGERSIIDPEQPRATRVVGEESWPLYIFDASLTLNLTGQKSWHQLVPVLNGGAGVVSDFKGTDAGGYRFGTQFAFSFGAGLRWVPGGRFQARIDVSDHVYQISYPESYRFVASDTTSVISDNQALRHWTHNAAIMVGASYLFFR